MNASPSPGMLPRHLSSDSLLSLDANKLSSTRKRSDIREEEVAQLLAEGRAHVRTREATPQRWQAGMMNSRLYNSSTDISADILQTPSGKPKTRHRREASAGNNSPPSADWGEEYLHTSKRNTPNMVHYKQSVPSPQLSSMMRSMKMDEPVLRGRHTYLPRSLSHTRNLTNALKQCKLRHTHPPTEGSASEVLMQQLESAAELADMLNQGLRASVGHASLIQSQNTEDSLNADLHTLLHYSDEQVRHLTEALLALMQGQRDKTYTQNVSHTPRQASKQRISDFPAYTSFSPVTRSSHKHSVPYATQHAKELRSSSRHKVGSPPGSTLI